MNNVANNGDTWTLILIKKYVYLPELIYYSNKTFDESFQNLYFFKETSAKLTSHSENFDVIDRGLARLKNS